MSKALSVDLRTRVLDAVSAGASHREAAERFGVGVASIATVPCSNCVMLCLRKVSSSASQSYTVSLSGTTRRAKKRLAMR